MRMRSIPDAAHADPAEVLTLFTRRWLDGYASPATRSAYAAALSHFGRFLAGVDEIEPADAGSRLLSLDDQSAVARVREYRCGLTARGETAGGIQRMTALRGLAEAGRQAGIISWNLAAIRPGTRRPVRTIRAIRENEFKRMLHLGGRQPNGDRARRNVCLLRMLFDCGLRSHEARQLRLDDLDLDSEAPRFWVRGKRALNRTPVAVPPPTLCALRAWLSTRGEEPGYVFIGLDPCARSDRPLSRKSLWEIVAQIGSGVGIRVSPHELRHGAITRAARVCRGNMLDVAAFARHVRPASSFQYVSAWRERAGAVARRVAMR
jgi:integrase